MIHIFGVLSKDPDISSKSIWRSLTAQIPSRDRILRVFSVPSGMVAISVPVSVKESGKVFHKPGQGWVFLTGHVLTDSFPPGKEAPEFLFELHCQQGAGFLKNIDGIFSVVIWDERSGRILIANDKLGMFPVFCYEDESRFIFSTEAAPLLKVAGIRRHLSHDAVAEFFHAGYLLHGRTFVHEIANIPPGSLIECGSGRIVRSRYFGFAPLTGVPKTEEGRVRAFAECFGRAVRRRAGSQAACFSALTGGWDTRFMIANLMKAGKQVHVFTSNVNKQDVTLARMVAKRFGLRHFIIPSLEDRALSLEQKMAYQLQLNPFGEREERDEASPAKFVPPMSRAMTALLASAPSLVGLGGEMINNKCSLNLTGTSYDLKAVFSRDFLRRMTTTPEAVYREERNRRAFDGGDYYLFLYLAHYCRSSINALMASTWRQPVFLFRSSMDRFPFFDVDVMALLCTIPVEKRNYYFYYKVFQKVSPEFLEVPLLMRVRNLKGCDRQKMRGLKFWVHEDDDLADIKQRVVLASAWRILARQKDASRGFYCNMQAAARQFPMQFIIFQKWYETYGSYLD